MPTVEELQARIDELQNELIDSRRTSSLLTNEMKSQINYILIHTSMDSQQREKVMRALDTIVVG